MLIENELIRFTLTLTPSLSPGERVRPSAGKDHIGAVVVITAPKCIQCYVHWFQFFTAAVAPVLADSMAASKTRTESYPAQPSASGGLRVEMEFTKA